MSVRADIKAFAPRLKTQHFFGVGPLQVSSTAGSPTITVAAPDGARDPINEIRIGMNLQSVSVIFSGGPTVTSINVGARTVTFSANAGFTVANTQAMFGRTYTFTVPSGVYKIYASFTGGGLGGSGGFTSAGGGGGGGGASSSFLNFELLVEPGEILSMQLGCGGLGGAVNTQAVGHGGSSTLLDTRTNIYTDQDADGYSYIASSRLYVPTARPSLTASLRSAAGTSTTGGRGGDGGPMYSTSGGPAGGAGAAASANAGAGAHSLRRGEWGWTGGAGGGGAGPTSSIPGDGGTDMVHTDAPGTAEDGGGGYGGSSSLGKGGWGGTTATPRGSDAKGYGSGGGGGKTGGGGGHGAPGMVSLSWFA